MSIVTMFRSDTGFITCRERSESRTDQQESDLVHHASEELTMTEEDLVSKAKCKITYLCEFVIVLFCCVFH